MYCHRGNLPSTKASEKQLSLLPNREASMPALWVMVVEFSLMTTGKPHWQDLSGQGKSWEEPSSIQNYIYWSGLIQSISFTLKELSNRSHTPKPLPTHHYRFGWATHLLCSRSCFLRWVCQFTWCHWNAIGLDKTMKNEVERRQDPILQFSHLPAASSPWPNLSPQAF